MPRVQGYDDIRRTISKGLMYNLLQFDASIQGSTVGLGFAEGLGLGLRVLRVQDFRAEGSL